MSEWESASVTGIVIELFAGKPTTGCVGRKSISATEMIYIGILYKLCISMK